MIRFQNISIQLGNFRLQDVSFEIPTGTYAVLMGRTGCGKTTLLEAACGLRPIAAGRIHLMGRDVTNLAPGRRNVGFVPQDGALFTTMTVAENLGFALRVQRCKRREIDARVSELAHQLDISHLLQRRPYGLSGGERQRVALGRALAARPDVLCLDEPLAALDEQTHADMLRLLRHVHDTSGVTLLHITHNRREARELGQQLLVLRDGRMLQDDQIGSWLATAGDEPVQRGERTASSALNLESDLDATTAEMPQERRP